MQNERKTNIAEFQAIRRDSSVAHIKNLNESSLIQWKLSDSTYQFSSYLSAYSQNTHNLKGIVVFSLTFGGTINKKALETATDNI